MHVGEGTSFKDTCVICEAARQHLVPGLKAMFKDGVSKETLSALRAACKAEKQKLLKNGPS